MAAPKTSPPSASKPASKTAAGSPLQTVLGQPSWVIATPQVEAVVTQQAGHLAPVRFQIAPGRWVEPFEVAPWTQDAFTPPLDPLMQAMRGDFFCMPFGGNARAYKGEQHLSHGETARERWTLESLETSAPDGLRRLTASLETRVRAGRVTKVIELIPGHTAVYSRHVVSGMKGPMPLGHHPILKLPRQGAGRVSVSRFTLGQVYPGVMEDPAAGGYSCLKAGAKFRRLERVARADGGVADLSVYPAREGFEDIVMMAADPGLPFAWTALVVDGGDPKRGYVWFSLKNPRVLRSTVFWMSNGGRHYAPWNGRHRCAIGLEEVTAHFHDGLAESAAPNALQKAGIETAVQLHPKKPLEVSYIMAVAAIPSGFDRVKSIVAAADRQSVTLTAESGAKIAVPLNVGFVL